MTQISSPSSPRVRFAPAPTGLMHLGNVRAALMNFLYARQHNGTFIVRVEDTDAERNYDPGAVHIMADLAWLGLACDEGPGKGGPYAPYFQSERTPLYTAKLEHLIQQGHVYRCFCTAELLEKKRERQIALKHPPRYDRLCATLSSEVISKNLHEKIPYVWRLKVPEHGDVTITDIARGTVHFNLKNFSDTPLTRQDGSFTFLFANFVDDMSMRITHIFRGEDHITNTAVQSIMYQAFEAPVPVYWHMPIICNIDGKKLSKRDFGFSLNDLRNAGYLPEAICNYLAIIGSSFKQEIMTMDELINTIDFEHIGKSGQIKYDVEKLVWINQSWIKKLDPADLALRCLPFLKQHYDDIKNVVPNACSVRIDETLLPTLTHLVRLIQSDLQTLRHSIELLKFYFERPVLEHALFTTIIPDAILMPLVGVIQENMSQFHDTALFNERIKKVAKERAIPLNFLFAFLRIAITGAAHGMSVQDLIAMIGKDEARIRLDNALRLFV
jgi:glutamyl-tRNA synthetase